MKMLIEPILFWLVASQFNKKVNIIKLGTHKKVNNGRYLDDITTTLEFSGSAWG